jgi:hypothetical protein
MQPDSTIRSRVGFWEIEAWVIRPRPSLRLQSYNRVSCRDEEAKSVFGFKDTLTEKLPISILACRGVKKLSPIIPSADVGNLQIKNE